MDLKMWEAVCLQIEWNMIWRLETVVQASDSNKCQAISYCGIKSIKSLCAAVTHFHLIFFPVLYLMSSYRLLELLDHINIKSLFRGQWEWWKARGTARLWSVFSQDPTTTNGRETTTPDQWSESDHNQTRLCSTFDHQTRNCEKKLQ